MRREARVATAVSWVTRTGVWPRSRHSVPRKPIEMTPAPGKGDARERRAGGRTALVPGDAQGTSAVSTFSSRSPAVAGG